MMAASTEAADSRSLDDSLTSTRDLLMSPPRPAGLTTRTCGPPRTVHCGPFCVVKHCGWVRKARVLPSAVCEICSGQNTVVPGVGGAACHVARCPVAVLI